MNTIPKKYACKLTLDPNTAHRKLHLSERNTKAECLDKDQLYPDHLDRFDYWEQVLSVESLSGQCYWEAEWTGRVETAVCYKGIRRRGGSDCLFGLNNLSWRLYSSRDGYTVCHDNQITAIPNPPSCRGRLGVYLDWTAGKLTFYNISPSTHALTTLYTFSTRFTEPVFAGFRLYENSSVHVC